MSSQSRRQTIDWSTAQRVGELIAGSPGFGAGSPGFGGRSAPQDLAHEFARRVSEYTGLELPDELPPLEMVDRPAWIAANLATMRPMLDRALERLSGAGEHDEVDQAADERKRDETAERRNRDAAGSARDETAERRGRDAAGSARDGTADEQSGSSGAADDRWERRLGPLAGPLRVASGHLRTASNATSDSLHVASGHLLGAQLGAVTGLLSQRVLGQYDISLVGPPAAPRLLLLAPNLDAAARNLAVDRGELTAWVAIHEITHAVQFSGASWLRDHLGGLLEELLAGLKLTSDADLGALLSRARAGDLGVLRERVRQGELLRFGLGEQRWAIVERMQATMSLIEGHAEHTMDAVGQDVLPSLPRLRAALTRRRLNRGLPWRVLEKLLGLELKMRQYEVGRRFCDTVVSEAGPQTLTIAWRSPADLPSPAELNEPRLWLDRVRVPA